MARITKSEMAYALVNSPVWNGIKSESELKRRYSWEELHDMFEMMMDYEQDYYDSIY